MNVTAWKAWYTEDRQFASDIAPGFDTVDWVDLPDDGVLLVVLYMDETGGHGKPYRQILSGSDWYFTAQSENGLMYMSNNDSPEENKLRYPGCILKRGKGVDMQTMKIKEKLAQEDNVAPGPPCGAAAVDTDLSTN